MYGWKIVQWENNLSHLSQWLCEKNKLVVLIVWCPERLLQAGKVRRCHGFLAATRAGGWTKAQHWQLKMTRDAVTVNQEECRSVWESWVKLNADDAWRLLGDLDSLLIGRVCVTCHVTCWRWWFCLQIKIRIVSLLPFSLDLSSPFCNRLKCAVASSAT